MYLSQVDCRDELLLLAGTITLQTRSLSGRPLALSGGEGGGDPCQPQALPVVALPAGGPGGELAVDAGHPGQLSDVGTRLRDI